MIDGELEADVEALPVNSRTQVRPSARPNERTAVLRSERRRCSCKTDPVHVCTLQLLSRPLLVLRKCRSLPWMTTPGDLFLRHAHAIVLSSLFPFFRVFRVFLFVLYVDSICRVGATKIEATLPKPPLLGRPLHLRTLARKPCICMHKIWGLLFFFRGDDILVSYLVFLAARSLERLRPP